MVEPQKEADGAHLMTPIYKIVSDATEADAIAKAFSDKKPTMVEIPFKFPGLKPHELRARILFTGVCQSDAHISKSQWYETKYPVVPGHEIIAEITHVGNDVKGFKVGDRVGWGPQRFYCGECNLCKRGLDAFCQTDFSKEGETRLLYDPAFGGYATHFQGPALSCFHIPEALPSDKTPPLMCAGVTVFGPLQRYGFKGCKVGIIGVGGLGHLAVKFASKMGYKVTAFTSKVKEKEQDIKKMGAEAVVSSVDQDQIKALNNTFDLLLNTFDTKDSKLLDCYIHALVPNGTYCQVCIPDKKIPPPAFDMNYIVFNQIQIAGWWVGSRWVTEATLKFAAEHNILPDCEIYEWEEFQTAFKKCVDHEAKYRGVVNCENYAKLKNLPQ